MGWMSSPTIAGINEKGEPNWYWSSVSGGLDGGGMPIIQGMTQISDPYDYTSSMWIAPNDSIKSYYSGGQTEEKTTTNSSGRSSSSGLGSLNIPDDAYPWSRSGLPDWGMERVKSLTAGLGGLMDSYQGSLNQLEQAPALIDQWVGQSGDTFLQGLGDFEDYVRKPFMGLAGRGVLDSTMTRDAMTDIGTGLSNNFQDFMSETVNQGLALKAANLSDQAEARGKSVALGGDLLSLANESYSENKLAKWTALLSAVLG